MNGYYIHIIYVRRWHEVKNICCVYLLTKKKKNLYQYNIKSRFYKVGSCCYLIFTYTNSWYHLIFTFMYIRRYLLMHKSLYFKQRLKCLFVQILWYTYYDELNPIIYIYIIIYIILLLYTICTWRNSTYAIWNILSTFAHSSTICRNFYTM